MQYLLQASRKAFVHFFKQLVTGFGTDLVSDVKE